MHRIKMIKVARSRLRVECVVLLFCISKMSADTFPGFVGGQLQNVRIMLENSRTFQPALEL